MQHRLLSSCIGDHPPNTGANVIPTSIHHCCETDEILQNLVEDAASGHMNMLRVWGGGLYLPDSFYQECDQLGIMVWQEAMFACSPYPRNSAFLDNVCGGRLRLRVLIGIIIIHRRHHHMDRCRTLPHTGRCLLR